MPGVWETGGNYRVEGHQHIGDNRSHWSRHSHPERIQTVRREQEARNFGENIPSASKGKKLMKEQERLIKENNRNRRDGSLGTQRKQVFQKGMSRGKCRSKFKVTQEKMEPG